MSRLQIKDIYYTLQIIITIRENLNEDTLELLKNGTTNRSHDTTERPLFGSKIVYNQTKVLWPDTGGLRSMSLRNIIQSTQNFTMAYKDSHTEPVKSEVRIPLNNMDSAL